MRRDGSKRFQKWAAIMAAGVLLMGCNMGPEDLGEDGAGMEPTQLTTTEQAIYDYNGGHYYLFVVTPKTWEEAQSYCARNGYNLVTINNASEEAFLHTQEVMRGLPDWWIGYNDRGIEGWWTWTSGASSYVNWYPGEPNDAGGGEDCAADRYQGSDQWNDWPCTQQLPFICERDSFPTVEGMFDYQASNTDSAKINTFDVPVSLYGGMVLTVSTCMFNHPGFYYGNSYLRINAPNGEEIASNDDAGGTCGLGSEISLVAPMDGTYIIKAGCYGSGACGYYVTYDY